MLTVRTKSRFACLLASAFLLLLPTSSSFAADTSYETVFNNKSATGEELANAFFDLLSNTGSPTGTVGTTAEQDEASKALVKPYLDPAFLLLLGYLVTFADGKCFDQSCPKLQR